MRGRPCPPPPLAEEPEHTTPGMFSIMVMDDVREDQRASRSMAVWATTGPACSWPGSLSCCYCSDVGRPAVQRIEVEDFRPTPARRWPWRAGVTSQRPRVGHRRQGDDPTHAGGRPAGRRAGGCRVLLVSGHTPPATLRTRGWPRWNLQRWTGSAKLENEISGSAVDRACAGSCPAATSRGCASPAASTPTRR